MDKHCNLNISNFRFAILTSCPTALLGRAAFAAFERFAAGKTSAEGRLRRPEHSNAEGCRPPLAAGTQNKRQLLSQLPFVLCFVAEKDAQASRVVPKIKSEPSS